MMAVLTGGQLKVSQQAERVAALLTNEKKPPVPKSAAADD